MKVDMEDKVVAGVLVLLFLIIIGIVVWAVTLPDSGKPAKVCPVIANIAICTED